MKGWDVRTDQGVKGPEERRRVRGLAVEAAARGRPFRAVIKASADSGLYSSSCK